MKARIKATSNNDAYMIKVNRPDKTIIKGGRLAALNYVQSNVPVTRT